jgi:S-sulfo-L-cysteine synthase (3-phospho-L-serine-dependent)
MRTTESEAALLETYRPALIPLGPNLTGAAFPLMKVLPAEFCLRRAAEDGTIGPDAVIVETSSGTMALGLAVVCNWRRHELIIVSDYACDSALRARLEHLGARVEIVSGPAATGGYQRARLDRLHEFLAERPNAWWPNQYDNLDNLASYAGFAGQLIETCGRVDCLVGTVGSGGSLSGTSRYLRLLVPDLRVVGVDTFGSVLFGQPDAPRQLRGLGNSLLPANLDHQAVDEVHWVSAAEAYLATRMLYRATSLFRGGTSGAAWMVARHWAQQHPDRRVVCLLPDDGQRYVHTLYNDAYLREQRLWLDRLPPEPIDVDSPADAHSSWSRFQWGRRAYQQVVMNGLSRPLSETEGKTVREALAGAARRDYSG